MSSRTNAHRARALRAGLALAVGLGTAVPASAQDGPRLRIGFVTFLSGPAAGPFGVPARNAAELVLEHLNAGTMPAPYDSEGIAGARIEPVLIDEAGGTAQQTAEFRNLVERQNVDLVIGYISSGDCLAVAPVAEELQTLTVFFDCGTPRIFEDAEYRYVFRTGSHATKDNVAAARYLLELQPDVATIAGINQNYAWGQDSWEDFKAAMQALKPDVEIASEQFPQLMAGSYGAEISALSLSGAAVIHSSFWGGDLEAFVLQGAARGLFDQSQAVLTTGETAMFRLGPQMPDGIIIGGRGPHGVFAPESDLNSWFRQEYYDRFGTWPTYPSYKMAMAILGVKAAFEKAAGTAGGELPEIDQVIEAFEHLEFESPSGAVSMAIGKGHQAVQETAYGLYQFDADKGEATVTDVKRYPAACVNPWRARRAWSGSPRAFRGPRAEPVKRASRAVPPRAPARR
jgi:branched-chain amino acid transport system substrate-binding protein